jgi:ornithine cyclodeaminase
MSAPVDIAALAGAPLWISEAEVVAALHLGEAIDALERCLPLEAKGQARSMAKTHATWGGGHTLHAIGAVIEGAGVVGTKSWAHTSGGATPLLLLWGAEDGKLLAIIEAFALGQMRTGGIAGVATRWMASEGADELAIIGTGKQSLTQVAAVAAVRRLRRIRVFSPTEEHRRKFVAELTALLPEIESREAGSVEAALDGAPIVTLVTRARQPFVSSRMLARGSHVNAVGAITPEREEFAQDVFDRVDAIAVDNIASVQALSAEFRRRFAEDWSSVRPLSAVVASKTSRPATADLTLFKAMGMGLSDLALGIEILARIRRSGGGRVLPHPKRAAPRLRA